MKNSLPHLLRNTGRRLPVVGFNLGYNLLPSVFSVLLSWYVVRQDGLLLWGQWVYIGAVVSFLALVAHFGLKDQLLRAFSLNPGEIPRIWIQQVLIRLWFLAPVCASAYFLLPGLALPTCIWIFCIWLIKVFEVFPIFEKRFAILFFAEFAYWAMFGGLLVLDRDGLQLAAVLNYNLLAISFRVVLVAGSALRMIKWPHSYAFRWVFPKAGLTFFILSLTGLLEARTDVFCIKWILGAESIGRYSLIFSFLLILKYIPDFVLGPFLRNFYRSDIAVFHKASRQVAVAGAFISVAGVVVFSFVFEWMYPISYSAWFYGLGILYVFPRFLFCMDIYRIFQQKREMLMVGGICTGLVVNGLLNVLLLPRFGVESALAAAAAGQWVMWLYFKAIMKRQP